MRNKEAAAFAAENSEAIANIAAIKAAISALEKGMAGGFLQTGAAQILKKLALSKQNMNDGDRQELLSFLSGRHGSGYAPQSGEITGILKQIGDDMAKSLAEATAAEEAAIKAFKDLTSAKTKEIDALTAAIESKTERD